MVDHNNYDVSREVFRLTVDPTEGEVGKGWAVGPLSEKEVSNFVGCEDWVCSRRFGVDQGFKKKADGTLKRKIRQIDDMSESFVNSCVEIHDKVGLSTIDGIAAYVKCWHNAIDQARTSKGRTATFTLSSGKHHTFKVREEYLGEG